MIDSVYDKKLLSEYYSIADVFINLSHEETYSTTLLESTSCNVPSICYDVCGNKEIVNTNNGIVIRFEDKDVYKYIEIIKEKGKNTYKDNKHSLQNMVKEYIGLYLRVYDKN